MSKVKPNNTAVTVSHNLPHIKAKLEEYKHLLSPDEIAKAQLSISNERPMVLSPNIEDILYSSFVLGKTLTEIAEHHAYPVEVVVVTALHYNWWKRVGRDAKDSDIAGIEITANTIAENCLLIVNNAVRKQMQDISSGKVDSRESLELVSMAVKEMKNISAFIGSMRDNNKLLNASNPSKPMVQISNQTLNVAGQQTKTEVIGEDKKLLPSSPEDRIKDLEEIESLGK